MTLYEELLESGVELDHRDHTSDLYVRATPKALRLIMESGLCWSAFRSQIDGKLWIDVPFAFDPYWNRRTTMARERAREAGAWPN